MDGGLAPEPGGRWPLSLEPDRLVAHGGSLAVPTRCSSTGLPRAPARRPSALSGELPGTAAARACDGGDPGRATAPRAGRRAAAGFFGVVAGAIIPRPRPRRISSVCRHGWYCLRRSLEQERCRGRCRSGRSPAATWPGRIATLFSAAPLLQTHRSGCGLRCGRCSARRGGTRSVDRQRRAAVVLLRSRPARGAACEGAAGAASARAHAAHRPSSDAG